MRLVHTEFITYEYQHGGERKAQSYKARMLKRGWSLEAEGWCYDRTHFDGGFQLMRTWMPSGRSGRGK